MMTQNKGDASSHIADSRSVKQPSPVERQNPDQARSKQVNPGNQGLNPGQKGPAQPDEGKE